MSRREHVGTLLLPSIVTMALAAMSACSMEIVDTLVGAGHEQAADDPSDAPLEDTSDDSEAETDEGGATSDDEQLPIPLFDVGDAGSSITSCEFAAQFPSHIGCEFYGLDLDGPGLFDSDPSGFVVINPLGSPVEVTLERHEQLEWVHVETKIVAGEDEAVFLAPEVEEEENQNHATGLYEGTALRLTGTAPIIVIQASPAEGEGHSASATMLQPTAAWLSTNPVAGWRTHQGVGEPSFVGVVAQTGGTSVAVTPVFGIEDQPAGWEQYWTEEVNPNDPNAPLLVPPLTLPVEPGQLLRLDATAIDAAEVDHGTSGSHIESGQEHLISVFSAHTCAAIPDYEGSCGHMQEHLSPRLVGTRFVGPRLIAADAGLGPDAELVHERTMIQVVATEPDTKVVFSYLDGQDSVVLEAVVIDPDEPYAVYESERELTVVADRPIIAAAYMTNAQLTPLGSPSMVQLAPVDQWTSPHWVWVPDGFDTHLIVSSTADASVTVQWLSGLAGDDTPQPSPAVLELSETAAAGFAPLTVRRYAVGPGIHRIESSGPASIVVAGWRAGDGFAYLGGWGASLTDLGAAG